MKNGMKGFFPIVFEQGEKGERSYDIPSKLLKDRIILLTEEVEPYLAASVAAQLLFLEKEDSKKEITIYVMSPGGCVSSGLAIYDTMQIVKPPVRTVCMGEACSMGAILLLAGAKGKRAILPNARVMIHQPWGGVGGDTTSIQIQAKEYEKCRRRLTEITAKHTGKTYEECDKIMERDSWFSAEEAKEFGIVDQIIGGTK